MGGTADECYTPVTGAGRSGDFRMGAFIALSCYKVGKESYITNMLHLFMKWNSNEFYNLSFFYNYD